MKPHRIRMTHNLLLNYGLYRKMEIYVIPRKHNCIRASDWSEWKWSFRNSLSFSWILFSVHTRQPQTKWPNSIRTITSDSCVPFVQTICPNTTNKCNGVSKKTGAQMPRFFLLLISFGIHFDFPVYISLSTPNSQCRWRLSRLRWPLWILSIVGWWFGSGSRKIKQASVRDLYQLGWWTASC